MSLEKYGNIETLISKKCDEANGFISQLLDQLRDYHNELETLGIIDQGYLEDLSDTIGEFEAIEYQLENHVVRKD